MRRVDASRDGAIAEAARALQAGQIVAYPTETVYGLGVDPFNVAALKRLFEAKGRDREKALLLIVGREAHLDHVASTVSSRARRYMEAFWPGPLSLLLPRHPGLPDEVAPGLDKICVRCPGAPVSRALCDAFGGAITSTSANASGDAPVRMLEDLGLAGIELGLDGGELAPSASSTILDPETGEILREGALSRTVIAAI